MANDDEIARESEDIRLQIAHARAALYDRAKLQREARRQYAREYYAKHREEHADYQRQRRAAQREKDPDAYRRKSRERNQRWRDGHKEEVNAKIRAKYHADPEKHRQRRREEYAANPEENRARRREYYAKNREKQNAAHRIWRDREKRRREAGLPPRRLHTTRREERLANTAAANAFFDRVWTARELVQAHKSIQTSRQLWAEWKRDCLRARAAYHLAEQKEELARLRKELGRARTGPKPKSGPTKEEIEEARLEAIGRQVNERLRHREPPRRPHHLDPAAPHPMLQPNQTTGMNR
ncbi:hypothetical protein ACPW96_20140 [Micromonospora sp. DT81.3]|uniref:hypothetical protein n=1 Tax=Micromonospora sp. DT81.3 TaxID=3416523 RepID=UPI003CEC82E1